MSKICHSTFSTLVLIAPVVGMIGESGQAQTPESGVQKPKSGALECRVMQAMSGDASVPVKVCRTPGGVWHRAESSLGENDGVGFQGHIIYNGQFSGTIGRIQRTTARVSTGGFNLNLGNIETGITNQRDIGGTAIIQITSNGLTVEATFNLRGQGFNQQIILRGNAGEANCILAEAAGTARFIGQCSSQGLRGVLKTENRLGWRTEVSINTTMQSRQSSAEIALAAAAERQRQQEAQKEQAEQIEQAIIKLTIRAKAGDLEAMGTLGDMYDGNNSDLSDPVKSAYWYSMAAQHGDPRSMLNLGIDYNNGDGVDKNTTLASSLFLKCAKISSKYQTSCARNIGVAYVNGDGVDKNKQTGLYWLRYCARLGDAKCDEIANEVNGTN